MEKKSNFVQVPLWLSDEFKTVKEFQAFIKMYNGWCLMKDADGWYYRSKSKLKEDFGMNTNCSDTRVTQLTKRFEGLGILHIKSEGKKANWYKFDEEVLFNHIEEETSEQVVPKGKEQVVPKGKEQVVPKQEDNDRNKLYLQYNTKENMKENILEIETDIKNTGKVDDDNSNSTGCTTENLANEYNMKIDERLITEDEKEAWDVLSSDDNFDYTQYEDISEMVQSDARNIGMLENPTYFEKKKNNEYVSKMFKKLKYYIREYKNSTSVEMANDWGYKVNDVYGSLDRSKFTESQWVTISNMIDEFDTLYEYKEKYLSKKYHKQTGSNVTKKTVSSENSIISDGLSDSEHCPSPAPSIEREDNMMIMRATMSEDEIAQLSKKSTKQEEKRYGKYDNVDEWLKAVDEKWGLTTQEPMADYGNNSIQ